MRTVEHTRQGDAAQDLAQNTPDLLEVAAGSGHGAARWTSEFGFAPVDLGTLREGGRLIQLGGPLSALHALKQD